MHKHKITGHLLAIAFLALAASGIASAQATRTWVSGVGDDANPCSRTAPCQTIAAALPKTAAGGEIDCLDPGEFNVVYDYTTNPPTATPAPITITKAITIDCGGIGGRRSLGGLSATGSFGITVAAGASDPVTIRNLSINGMGTGGTGIIVSSGAVVRLENVAILNFTTAGVALTSSGLTKLSMFNVTIDDTGVGVDASGYGGSNSVVDLESVRIFGCAPGVSGGSNAVVNVGNSVLSMNGSAIRQTTGLSQVNVTASALNTNGNAIRSNSTSLVRAYGNTIFQNGTGFNSSGGTIFSDGTNDPGGNASNGTANGGLITKN